jgi:magnesium transporter
MARLQKKRSGKIGLPPGSLVHIGDETSQAVNMSIIDYREDYFHEETTGSIEKCVSLKDSGSVIWINIDGIHQPATLEKLGQCYGLHPLVLEDIMATDQRPKLEDFGDYLFIVLKMIRYNGKNGGLSIEQVSLILGRNYLISFQEGREGDVFNPLRERIRTGKGRVRQMGADYLAYGLMDAIIDNYYLAIDRLGEEIEAVEERLVANPVPETLRRIHKMRRDIIFLRKSVWPLREVIGGLERLESPLFAKTTAIYLRDIYDHTIRVIETIETYRDMLAVMLDVYLSSVNNRLNAVMKVLTVIATIFMPLTFIAGVYGMNFKSIPGLEWEWSFAVFCGAMGVITIGMLLLFRRKKWL